MGKGAKKRKKQERSLDTAGVLKGMIAAALDAAVKQRNASMSEPCFRANREIVSLMPKLADVPVGNRVETLFRSLSDETVEGIAGFVESARGGGERDEFSPAFSDLIGGIAWSLNIPLEEIGLNRSIMVDFAGAGIIAEKYQRRGILDFKPLFHPKEGFHHSITFKDDVPRETVDRITWLLTGEG